MTRVITTDMHELLPVFTLLQFFGYFDDERISCLLNDDDENECLDANTSNLKTVLDGKLDGKCKFDNASMNAFLRSQVIL